MKRRRVFQVVVEYDTEYDQVGMPKPDEQVTAEEIHARIVDVPIGAWDWCDGVRVTEEDSDVRRLIADLADPDDCWFDHHGGCQAHGYLSLEPGEVCPQAAAKQWMANHPGEG